MKIEYITGNLLTSDELNIAHQVSVYGKRVWFDAHIKDVYPFCYSDYRDFCQGGGEPHELLGKIFVYQDHLTSRKIFNLFSQFGIGRSQRMTSYDALANIFWKLNDYDLDRLAMPMLGSGLAGGDWSVISAIIESESHNYQPVVYRL